jgi:hypothetical protein
LNGDGFRDLIVTNAATYGGPDPVHRIFLNPGAAGNHWLTVRLIGSVSNRFGIGARVTASANGKTYLSEIATSVSSFAGVHPEAHFGLGGAATLDRLEVRWPSGRVSTLAEVTTNQVLTIVEP